MFHCDVPTHTSTCERQMKPFIVNLCVDFLFLGGIIRHTYEPFEMAREGQERARDMHAFHTLSLHRKRVTMMNALWQMCTTSAIVRTSALTRQRNISGCRTDAATTAASMQFYNNIKCTIVAQI